MYRGLKVAVVIPAFNEEGRIAKVISTVPRFVDWVFVVDDCSRDGTFEAALSPRSMVIKNGKNLGVGGSIIMGHKAALGVGSDVDVVMAGDGQMNPLYLPRLLDAIIEGADYAKGNRFADLAGMPAHRVLGNAALTLLTRVVSGYWGLHDPQNGYTAVKMTTFKRLDVKDLNKRYQFENDMLVHLSVVRAKVKDVPMPSEYHGETSRLQLRTFVPQTVFFLLERFVWRRLSGGRRNTG